MRTSPRGGGPSITRALPGSPRSLADEIEGDGVLVGHSYDEIVITNAAAGHDRGGALVSIGGFAPDTGETATGSPAIDAAVTAATQGSRDLVVAQAAVRDQQHDIAVPPH